jgi:4,5-DOPA dioxygenase extradiol
MDIAKPMPTIFFGHGKPMNGLRHDAWTDGWSAIGKEIHPRLSSAFRVWPLVLSHHSGNGNCGAANIHDFGGFPSKLQAIEPKG